MLIASSWVNPIPEPVRSDDTQPLTVPHDGNTSAPYGTSAPHMDIHGCTDRGRHRERNEDQFLVADLNRTTVIRDTSLTVAPSRRWIPGPQGRLLVVADGLGGQGAGDLASAIAVDVLTAHVTNDMPWVVSPRPEATADEADDVVAAHLRRAMSRCDAHVRHIAEKKGFSDRHPGSTLTAALVLWPHLYVAHAGDSRAYLYRDRQLRRITRDHTLYEQMREASGPAPDLQVATPWKHMLFNAIGGEDGRVLVELHRLELERDDVFLLCTDGLTNHVSDEGIAAFLELGGNAQSCCEALVEAANAAGGSDNITVVIACA
jgi:serine/threonine protein phosphatase PrpC